MISRQVMRLVRFSRRLTLSRVGAYYLFIVLCVYTGTVVRDSNPMLLLAAMLTGPLVIGLWFVLRGLRRVEVRRELPGSICAGERLIVEVTCTNPRRRLTSWALVVEDAFQYLGPLALRRPVPARVLFPYLPPGATCRASYEGVPPLRGQYRFGPLRLVTRYPLGLWRYQKVFDQSAVLTVWPRLGQLAPGGLKLEEHGELGLHRAERRKARLEADFYGLRDWRHRRRAALDSLAVERPAGPDRGSSVRSAAQSGPRHLPRPVPARRRWTGRRPASGNGDQPGRQPGGRCLPPRRLPAESGSFRGRAVSPGAGPRRP